VKVGATVRDELLMMLIVVVGCERVNDAELSPPRFRVFGNEVAVSVLLVQKDTHL